MNLSTVSAFKNIKTDLFIEIDDQKIKELQNVLLDILIDIDFVCRKYQINYSLAGGSALGLIRHKGFIPWDDDVDLLMTRSNYTRFCKLFLKEMADKYWLHTPEDTKDYGLCLSRVRKKGTVCRSREDYRNNECGVYVDIFIVENTYNSAILRKIHGFFSLALGFILSCRNFWENRTLYKSIGETTDNPSVFNAKIRLGFLFSFFKVDTWTHLWNKINSICKDNRSFFVTVPAGRKHFFGELYERKYLDEYMDMPFYHNDKKFIFLIMKGYDYYLTKLYGDYLEIPPVEKREKHIVLEYDLGPLRSKDN